MKPSLTHPAFRLAVATALLAPLAHAHGGMDHVMGTVAKIDGDVVTVENAGKRSEVWLIAATTYELGPHAMQRGDLHVGDRVVIHAVKVDGREQAHDVRFTHPAR